MLQALKRVSLVLCVVASTLMVGTSAASAAGKPTSVEITNTHELGGYTVLELTAKANPNGASTSTTIELREEGTATWKKGVTHNLSGTTVRSFSEEFPVKPVTSYEARVTASNLYGTTESSIAHGVSTHVKASGEKELTNVLFESSGVANFTFTYVGIPIAVVCNEGSSGYIGNPGGKEDIYKYSISGCVTYVQGKESSKCKVKNFTFTLSGPTLAVQNPYFIPLPSACAIEEEYWQIYPEGFRVVDNGSNVEYNTSRSVTLTATGALYSSNPAEVTIESNWRLVTGTPFKITGAGL